MSIDAASRAGFNLAVTSGLDSISSGISKSVEGGNVKAEVIQSFRAHGDPHVFASPRDPAIQIAAGGEIPEPAKFFSNLTAEGKQVAKGLRNSEIADKLKPGSNLDLNRSSAGLKNSFEEEIKKQEEKLNALGDDAQLANVDLQNVLQKQQQTLQMMSNISKMLYDTAQGVIRKMGG
jgi:hypothetical protein